MSKSGIQRRQGELLLKSKNLDLSREVRDFGVAVMEDINWKKSHKPHTKKSK